jgi:hypothetical protein
VKFVERIGLAMGLDALNELKEVVRSLTERVEALELKLGGGTNIKEAIAAELRAIADGLEEEDEEVRLARIHDNVDDDE